MLTQTNTYYSSNSSLSLNTNVMLGDTPVPPKPEQTGVTNQPQDSKGENQPSGTTNVGIHQGSSYGKGKTLATIGNGSIIVGGEETGPEGLNRDVDNIDKELYSIERTKGDLDVTIQNKHLEQLVDAVDSVIDTLNKASPELAGNVADAADNLQQGASDSVEGKDTTGQQIAEKAEDINQREAESLLAQELVLPELGEPGDAPPMPEKGYEDYQLEASDKLAQQQAQEEARQQAANERWIDGIIQGWETAGGNGSNDGWIGVDADYESEIRFQQWQREMAYSSLGLGMGAAEGGLLDYAGWTAASVVNESWQGVQFLGKAATLGLISNPFEGSSYHSLIGDNTLFGSPQTFAGAVGVEQGVIASYFVGVEGAAVAAGGALKSFGKAGSKVEEIGLSPTLLNDLDRGGSYLMTETDFKKYAEPALNNNYPLGRPDGQFMTTSKEMNQAILDTGGDSKRLGELFGVDTWNGQNLIRIDVDNPTSLNPRLPSKNNSGANDNFIPGGKTSGGVSEIITDVIPPEKVWTTPVKSNSGG
ncbi:hypothetical protein QE250_15755 [Chromatiaceae bacterium AAb-1]|nr:hypothetical protein [Chromatiaceae bacterium AAb-1]